MGRHKLKGVLMRGMRVLLSVLVLSLVGVGSVGLAQTVFPVRLDDPEPDAASALASGGLTISTGNHYQARLLISVSPDTPEPILNIGTAGDVAITVRMSATSFRTDSQPFMALREELYSFRLLAGGGSQVLKGVIVAESADDHTFPNVLDTGAPASLTLRVDTPPNHDNVLLWVEVFASESVVFTELF